MIRVVGLYLLGMGLTLAFGLMQRLMKRPPRPPLSLPEQADALARRRGR
jgi:hypothetical protein